MKGAFEPRALALVSLLFSLTAVLTLFSVPNAAGNPGNADGVASVETKEATDVVGGGATLNARVSYENLDNVSITFRYRGEFEESWENTGWENTSLENYSKRISGLRAATVYEFFPVIRFGSSPENWENGRVATLNSGQISTSVERPLEVQVDDTGQISITVRNEYDDLTLRNVALVALENRYPARSARIGTLYPCWEGTGDFEFSPSTTGSRILRFRADYRVYRGDNYLLSRRKEIKTSILVTGAEHGNAIALRVAPEGEVGVSSAPTWIFDGETYRARLEIQNQRAESLTGVQIRVDGSRDYSVGTLQADETETVQIRIPPENYQPGVLNEYTLKAVHEKGTSRPLTLKFGVRPENAPVSVYLAKSNSPIYPGQKLEFTLVVTGASESEAEDLEIRALSDGVIPEGYWIGEEMKNLTEQQVSSEEIQDLLPFDQFALPGGVDTEGKQGEEEERDRSVIGKELYFEAEGLERGDNALRFRVSYELGNRLVTREFDVDFRVRGTPEVTLIQSSPVTSVEGEPATISLEVANEMSIEVEAVSIIPPEDIEITPSEYWIGKMSPGEFLPAEFEVQTRGLENKENLTFYPVYRVGGREFKGSPISVDLRVVDRQESMMKAYAIAFGILALAALGAAYWYRR